MKYEDKTFSVAALPTKEYKDNWDRIFGKTYYAKTVKVTLAGRELKSENVFEYAHSDPEAGT